MAGRGEPVPSGLKATSWTVAAVAPDGARLLAGPHVPDLDARVAAGRGEPLPVRAERHRRRSSPTWPLRSRRNLPVSSRPRSSRSVERGRWRAGCPVRAERDAEREIRHGPTDSKVKITRPVVASQSLTVPVRTGGGEPLPVGAERHASDRGRCASSSRSPAMRCADGPRPSPSRPSRPWRAVAVGAVRDVPAGGRGRRSRGADRSAGRRVPDPHGAVRSSCEASGLPSGLKATPKTS